MEWFLITKCPMICKQLSLDHFVWPIKKFSSHRSIHRSQGTNFERIQSIMYNVSWQIQPNDKVRWPNMSCLLHLWEQFLMVMLRLERWIALTAWKIWRPNDGSYAYSTNIWRWPNMKIIFWPNLRLWPFFVIMFGLGQKWFSGGIHLLPRDALSCKAWSCDRMSSVHLSICDDGGSGAHRLKSLETIVQHLRSSQPKGHPPTPRGTCRNFRQTRGGPGLSP